MSLGVPHGPILHLSTISNPRNRSINQVLPKSQMKGNINHFWYLIWICLWWLFPHLKWHNMAMFPVGSLVFAQILVFCSRCISLQILGTISSQRPLLQLSTAFDRPTNFDRLQCQTSFTVDWKAVSNGWGQGPEDQPQYSTWKRRCATTNSCCFLIPDSNNESRK